MIFLSGISVSNTIAFFNLVWNRKKFRNDSYTVNMTSYALESHLNSIIMHISLTYATSSVNEQLASISYTCIYEKKIKIADM